MINKGAKSNAVFAAIIAMTCPFDIMVKAQTTPIPTFEVDFSDQDSVDTNVQENTAEVLKGPGDVMSLRIDSCGKHAVLPVDINPSAMPDVTMVLGINLVSIADNSLGWALSTDDGGYDRSIIMHDDRFFGMGMATGDARTVWDNSEEGQPPLNEWIHVVAVYSQPADDLLTSKGVFYVNGKAAPTTLLGLNNGEGTSDLVVGTNMFDECFHWTDSWIKEVKIFDNALTTIEVEALYKEFQEAIASASDGTADDSNFFDGILDAIAGDSEDEESSDESTDEPGLLDSLLDTIAGSSAETIGIARNQLTMILLVGTVLVLQW